MGMTAAQNDRMTRTGRNDPAGLLLRRAWQPAALVEELQVSRPVKAIRLLGMDLVLFRDESGQLGLIERFCPHRGADLAFGRLEDRGLRCLFHGWLFDVAGKCLETPAEPPESTLCTRVRQRSYPVRVLSGIIFAYLGEGPPPELPALDCFTAPPPNVFAFKGLLDCNWLQALEVGLDPAHASYLHRFFEDSDPDQNYGRQFRANSNDSTVPMTKLLRENPRPTIEVETTTIGLRITALRALDAGRVHVRVTNLLFPQAFVIPLSQDITITQWHVPIDDSSCYWYAIFTSFGRSIDREEMRRQRLELYTLPDYKPRVGRHNNYGFDFTEQLTNTYTGMGQDINVHDQWAVESQGHIQDRTREHLASSDKAIVAFRRMLLAEITKAEAGERTMMDLNAREAAGITGPATVDGISNGEESVNYWRRVDAERVRGTPVDR